MDEIVGIVGDILSEAGESALESKGGKEAVAVVTAAAVKAASDSAKREVMTMLVPAFLLGALAMHLRMKK
jgi:hypothetical protein